MNIAGNFCIYNVPCLGITSVCVYSVVISSGGGVFLKIVMGGGINCERKNARSKLHVQYL